jgi:hypothetical protein
MRNWRDLEGARSMADRLVDCSVGISYSKSVPSNAADEVYPCPRQSWVRVLGGSIGRRVGFGVQRRRLIELLIQEQVRELMLSGWLTFCGQ